MWATLTLFLTVLLFDASLATVTGTIPNCQGVLKDFDITTQNEPEPLLFTTLKSCCNACKKDSNCKAWVWSSSQSACWLKSEVGNRFYSKSSQGLYSGYPSERLGTERSCHGVAKGVDITPGANDISPVIPNSNIESCCNSCNNEFRCKAWVLNTEDSKCYLKTVDTPWVPNTKTISALPGYIDQGRCSGILSNFDTSPGTNDITSSTTSEQDDCCNLCIDNKDCKAYVWDGSTCFLKSVVGPRVYRAPTESNGILKSGVPTRGRAVATRCAGTTLGLDISPGSNDLTSIPKSTFDSCCDACNNNRQCKAWVMNLKDNTCYLKAVNQPWVENPTTVSSLRSCVGVAKSFDTKGKSIATLRHVKDLQTCCQACKDNNKCLSFTYDETLHVCSLKSVTGPRVHSPNTKLSTGLAVGIVPGASGCYAVTPGLNISPGHGHGHGNLYVKKDSSLDACCGECRFNDKCKGFVFNSKTKDCYIKSMAENWKVDSSDIISGLPRSLVQ